MSWVRRAKNRPVLHSVGKMIALSLLWLHLQKKWIWHGSFCVFGTPLKRGSDIPPTSSLELVTNAHDTLLNSIKEVISLPESRPFANWCQYPSKSECIPREIFPQIGFSICCKKVPAFAILFEIASSLCRRVVFGPSSSWWTQKTDWLWWAMPATVQFWKP